jgi:MarR family transcriptional regulator, teicoplanin-associated locus regulator
MAMPNTSRELRQLSEKNLIIKVNNPDDRRKQYIRLSKDGEAMMNEAFSMIESSFLKRIQNASKEDLEDIEQALNILQQKLFY